MDICRSLAQRAVKSPLRRHPMERSGGNRRRFFSRRHSCDQKKKVSSCPSCVAGDVDPGANRVTEVMLCRADWDGRGRCRFPRLALNMFIAQFRGAAMEGRVPDLFDFNWCRSRCGHTGRLVRGEDFEFGNSLDIG